MKIVRGNCGHIKARWDNHQNCLSCSSCSRLATCSTCSRWSEETWILADKWGTYFARRSVMRKKKQNKKKRLAVNSDQSDDNSFDGSTNPQGYIARGKTHQGGNYPDPECIQSVSPPVTGQPVTGHPVTNHSVITRHRTSGTGHLITSHQSTYQVPVIIQHSIGNEHWVASQSHRGSEQSFLNEHQNPTASKRVLLPLEPDFSQMLYPSIIGPPSNIWQSTDRYTSQSRQSRRDQPKTKHRTKKRRRHRSSSSSSSSRSSSLAAQRRSKKSKRSKHSHKRRRRLTSSSSSSSHDYGRYKRTRQSPQVAEVPTTL